METTNIQVKTLFNSDVQYIIPLFQRHYVWDQEEQWEPLWTDIKEKAYQRLSEYQRQQFTHFTGAIVIQQKQTNVDEVQKYEIIDGQQRLTTFQIILCALRSICKLYEFEKIEAEAERHILNQGTLLDDSDDEQYKLIPTEFDRASFVSLADKRVDDSSGQIHSTYLYFKNEIESYVNCDRNKMLALFHSILNDFGFVQILLDPHDEPEKIFESLNARGKPLLQFDLLRNNLFLRARIEENRDRLYKDYWRHFEDPYWETEKAVGRAKITLSERFFQHFIMAKLGEGNVTPLFNVYQRRLVGNNGVKHELSELKRYSAVYQELTDCAPDSEIGQAMWFYKTFDITTLHPFMLFIINELEISGSDLSKVLQILESYTMRRVLCIRSGARSYTKFFSKLIQKSKGERFDLRNFIDMLSNEKAKATVWPTDSEVKTFLTSGWYIYNINREVIRYILYRIELMKREKNPLLETVALVSDNQLSLEHIMPEKWQRTWSLPLGMEEDGKPAYESEDRIYYEDLFSDEYRENNPEWETVPFEDGLANESYQLPFQLAQTRSALLQSIGNLTLVTGRHNSKMSNKPFSEKKASLFRNSLLVTNKEISGNNIWDIPQINRRAEDLFTYFCSIWPSAESFAESIT